MTALVEMQEEALLAGLHPEQEAMRPALAAHAEAGDAAEGAAGGGGEAGAQRRPARASARRLFGDGDGGGAEAAEAAAAAAAAADEEVPAGAAARGRVGRRRRRARRGAGARARVALKTYDLLLAHEHDRLHAKKEVTANLEALEAAAARSPRCATARGCSRRASR